VEAERQGKGPAILLMPFCSLLKISIFPRFSMLKMMVVVHWFKSFHSCSRKHYFKGMIPLSHLFPLMHLHGKFKPVKTAAEHFFDFSSTRILIKIKKQMAMFPRTEVKT
jgi:hypothetical protein